MKQILLIFLLLLPSCRWFTSASRPIFSMTEFRVPDGTPAFKQGYIDGCSTALYSRGNDWYRSRYKYRFDPKMIGNSEYRFAHNRGYTWCFSNILSGNAGHTSFDKYLLPYGQDPAGMAAGNINSLWGGFMTVSGGGAFDSAQTADNSFDTIIGVMSGTSTSGAAFSSNPLWAGGSSGQFFGQ